MKKRIIKSFTLLMFGSLIGLFIYFNYSKSTKQEQKIRNYYSIRDSKKIEKNSKQLIQEPHIKFDGKSDTYASSEKELKLIMYSSKSAPAFHLEDFNRVTDPTIKPIKPQ